MRRQGITDLKLSAYAGWRETRVDFLGGLPFLETLDLMTVGLRDVSPLYELPNLRRLSISGVKAKVDFTKIPRLNHLGISWNHKLFASLLDCGNLHVLGLDRFTEKDLSSLRELTALNVLALSYSKIESLRGIGRFSELRRLSLAVTNRIQTLSGISACKELVEVSVEAAKILTDVDAVGDLPKLRTLFFTACPKIESLQFISKLSRLEYFALLQTSRVSDGDLSGLSSLPKLKHVSFVDRKHYNRRNSAFPKNYKLMRPD